MPVTSSITPEISKHLIVRQTTNLDDALEAMKSSMGRKRIDEINEDSEEMGEVSSILSLSEPANRDLVVFQTVRLVPLLNLLSCLFQPKISRLASVHMNAPQIYTNKFAVSKIPNLRQNSGWHSSRPYGQAGAHYYFRTSGNTAL